MLGNERLTRLQREYVPPTSDDALWADAIIIAMHNKIAGLPAGPRGRDGLWTSRCVQP